MEKKEDLGVARKDDPLEQNGEDDYLGLASRYQLVSEPRVRKQ